MIANIPSYIEWPVWVLLGLSLALCVAWDAGRGLVERFLAHRVQVHQIRADARIAIATETAKVFDPQMRQNHVEPA